MVMFWKSWKQDRVKTVRLTEPLIQLILIITHKYSQLVHLRIAYIIKIRAKNPILL